MSSHPELQGTDGGVVVAVHVHPGAGRSEIVGRHGDALKVRVSSPPVEGRANDAVAELVARTLGCKPAAVEVVGGRTSRDKRVQVTGVELAEAERLIDLALEPHGPNRKR